MLSRLFWQMFNQIKAADYVKFGPKEEDPNQTLKGEWDKIEMGDKMQMSDLTNDFGKLIWMFKGFVCANCR